MSTGLWITFGLISAYIVLLFWLARTGRMERYGLSLMLGFVLMIRTKRGRGIIDKIATPKRFWNIFGDLGTAVTLLGMGLMTVFFFWSVTVALTPNSGLRAFNANEVLVIPGVNPFVPLWYGIIALIVTLVVHEGGHGILARANNLQVKSLGLLFAVVPIGAFVEPDESELMAATRRKRLRVFGAGPMVNLVFALLFLTLFSAAMSAASPVEGVAVSNVAADSPAYRAGIEGGMILVQVNDTALLTWEDFGAYIDTQRPGDTTTFYDREGNAYQTTFGSAWDKFDSKTQDAILAENETAALEFARTAYFGINGFPKERIHAALSEPFGSTSWDNGAGGQSTLVHILLLMSLPLGEVQDAPYLSYYLPTFYDTPIDSGLFFIGLNIAFWIFWINLMVGLTNILPMLPLDGGHIFRDGFSGFLEKLRPKMDAVRREHIVGRTAVVMSFMILGAFILQILGPRLVN